ncbi:MAG: hypothetical protein R2838_23875 [Caldilineaceae bacterium]
MRSSGSSWICCPDPAERQALLAQSQFQVPFLLDYLAVFSSGPSAAPSPPCTNATISPAC